MEQKQASAEHLPTRYGTNDVSGCGMKPHAGCHTETYGNLTVISLTPEMHRKTCGYWYTIQSEARAHTAFASRENLFTWLEDRGLYLTGLLAEHGEYSVVSISGSYRRTQHLSYDAFYSLDGRRTRICDNGDYTLAVITEDDDGIANIHSLNCNLRDRPVFDYFASRRLVG